MIEDHAERMSWALATVIREYGTRGGDKDELLPAEKQDPYIAMAMRALDDYGEYVRASSAWVRDRLAGQFPEEAQRINPEAKNYPLGK